MNILITDDETSFRRTLRTTLETMGHGVVEARNSTQALEVLGNRVIDVGFLDLRLAAEKGLDLLPEMLKLAPALDVVIITAYATVETAVEAMRRGAFDYRPKPFTPDQLRLVLERIARARRLQTQVKELQAQVAAAVPEADCHSEEPAMRQAFDIALKAAASEATILLRGESGTGKGVLARVIHAHSKRSHGPLVTVNCPNLSAELLESELFGHVHGSFTGAIRDTVGKVAHADQGTLFLDEVGDLPGAVQPKLLRLLQEKCYERVGENETRTSDVRIVAATNRNLEADVTAGKFREDLLYRLKVIEVTVPPLRQRPRDIPSLIDHLLGFFARQTGKSVTGFTPEARAALLSYSWPGNIRELRNAIERGVILATESLVGLADLPSQVGTPLPAGVEVGSRATIDQVEAEHIRRLLAVTPSIDEAAQILGVDPSTLYRKRKKFGL